VQLSSCTNNKGVMMEDILLNKIKILESQLLKTQDSWLIRIWEDKIYQLMLKVSSLKR